MVTIPTNMNNPIPELYRPILEEIFEAIHPQIEVRAEWDAMTREVEVEYRLFNIGGRLSIPLIHLDDPSYCWNTTTRLRVELHRELEYQLQRERKTHIVLPPNREWEFEIQLLSFRLKLEVCAQLMRFAGYDIYRRYKGHFEWINTRTEIEYVNWAENDQIIVITDPSPNEFVKTTIKGLKIPLFPEKRHIGIKITFDQTFHLVAGDENLNTLYIYTPRGR